MKKLSLFALAAVGLLLGACSSNNDEANTSQGAGVSNTDGGFIAVNINLPSAPSASVTRALNDVYDDGLASEYAVKTAILMLFDGSSEDGATWVKDIDILAQLEKYNDVDNDNITTSYQVVSQLDNAITNNLYGLVLLNYGGIYTPGTHTLTTSTGTFVISSSTTFADIKALVFGDFAAQATSTNGFFMTNAILTTDKSEQSSAPAASNIHILENLTKTVYDTEAEARTKPAGSIFVERAVAKATLSYTATTIASTSPLTINSVTWAINNTEPTSYLVRKAHTASLGYSSGAFSTPYYRFVGNTAIGTTTIQPVTSYYRTYWCEDPNYSVDATTLVRPANATAAEAALKATGTSNPQYCNENTFNVQHQTYENTTRAIVKVVTSGGTFYTDNGENEQYTLDDINTKVLSVFINDSKFYNSIKDQLKAGQSLTLTADMFNVTWGTKNATTGVIAVTGVTVNESAAGWNWTSDTKWTAGTEADRKTAVSTAIAASGIQDDAVTGANVLHKVLEYTGGVVYYEARFEHFANTAYEKSLGTFVEATAKAQGDLAPWNCWESTDKPTAGNVSASYPGTNAEQNYLGRYGMVRNNWYDVNITAFNKIGLPVDPSVTVSNPDTPDDKIEDSKYISVKINVLSWAKRTQSWSF